MAAENDFVEGLDPTGLGSISASQLLQIVRSAETETNKALIVTSETEPDHVTNTRYTRYFWWKPTTAALKYYNGAAWVIVPVNAGAVDTTQLVDDSVTLAKIDVSEGSALQLLRINAAGTAPEWWTLAFTNNSIAVTKITPGTANYLLGTNSGASACEWKSAADIVVLIPAQGIPLAKLSTTGASTNKFLYYDGASLGYTLLDIGKLDVASLDGNRYLGTNAGATAFEMKTAPVLTKVFNTTTGTALLTADTKDITLTKPAGNTWSYCKVRFVLSGLRLSSALYDKVDFTWQTSPVAGTAFAASTAGGTTNTGMEFKHNNSDDSLSDEWFYEGIVNVSLVSTDVITIRATFTVESAGSITAPISWVFSAVGEYV